MKVIPFVLSMSLFCLAFFQWINNSPLNVELNLEIASSNDSQESLSDFGQVFWKSPLQKEFEEGASNLFALTPGENSYRIQIPSDTVQFRLDPRRSPGPFKIRSIRVRNSLLLPLAWWSPGDWGLEARNEVANAGSAGGEFQSLGFDPILNVNFWDTHTLRRAKVFNFLFSLVLGSVLSFIQLTILKKSNLTSGPKDSLRSKRERFIAAIVVGLTLIVGMGGVELAFRAALKHRYEQEKKSADLRWAIKDEKLVGHEFPSSWKGSFQSGELLDKNQFSFRLNRQGFRGKDWDLESQVQRIFILGDSYTFGWGVADSETYSFHLQKILDRGHQKFQILNGGIPGYGTLQELGVLEEWIDVLKPKQVILSYVMNDAQPPGTVPTHPKLTYRFATSWVIAELRDLVNSLFPANQPWVAGTKFAPKANYLLDHNSYAGRRAVEESLERIAQICRTRQISLWLVILPDFTENLDHSYRYRPIHQQILSTAIGLGVSTVDLLSHFEGRRVQRLRVPGDGHPNADAHQLIAKFISEEVALGKSSSPHRSSSEP